MRHPLAAVGGHVHVPFVPAIAAAATLILPFCVVTLNNRFEANEADLPTTRAFDGVWHGGVAMVVRDESASKGRLVPSSESALRVTSLNNGIAHSRATARGNFGPNNLWQRHLAPA